MEKKSKNNPWQNILKVIIVSLCFGLAGGIVGDILARAYILDQAFNLPFFGDVNLSAANSNGGLIIRDAKKVVVEQDVKISETINTVGSNVVGIYKKISLPATATSTLASIKDAYDLNIRLGQGLIITSDGWIMSTFAPPDGSSIKDYVAISRDHKIMPLEQLLADHSTSVNFIRAVARNLPVLQFAASDDIANGQQVLSINWEGDSVQGAISGFANRYVKGPFSSDVVLDKIKLDQKWPDDFRGAPVCSIGGQIVGFVNRSGEIDPIYRFGPVIRSLLKYGTLRRPSLGANYVNLSAFAGAAASKGALVQRSPGGIAVIKGSPAASAGIQEGDIINSIDNVELDRAHSLNQVLSAYLPGDKIMIKYSREGKIIEANIILGEAK